MDRDIVCFTIIILALVVALFCVTDCTKKEMCLKTGNTPKECSEL